MKKLSLIVAALLLSLSFAIAQRAITGTITDQKGEPMVGASVLVKGTTVGVISDVEGKYSLSVPAGSLVLVFSFAGYQTQEMTIGASNVIDASLGESVLNEVIVTALGVSKQSKALGYAAQQVGGDDIKGANTLNVVDALNGKVAGVQITNSSGALGSSSRIVLRGQTSLDGNNQALFVVDGLRIDNSEFGTEGSTQGVAQSNRAIDINPNDIESVTVLKGAAASALYGVDGARGVILITTKKGNKKGKGLSVEYSTTYTTSEANKFPELQTLFGKGSGGATAGFNTGGSTSWGPKLDTMFFDGVATEFDANGTLVGKSNAAAKSDRPARVYDPFAFFQRGSGWQHNFAINGGDADRVAYRLSFSNSNEEGIIPLNTYQRTNVGIGTTANLLDNKFHFRSNFQYIKSNARRIQQGSNLSGVMLGLLRTPPTFDNSNGVTDPVNDSKSYYLSDGRQRTYRNGGGYDNPYWIVNNAPYNDEVNRFLGNVDITYDLTSWMSVNAKVGTDVYQDNRLQEFEINSRTAPAGRVIDDRYTYRSVDAYLTLRGSKNLTNDIGLSYTVGGNVYTSLLDNPTVTGEGLGYAGFRNLLNTSSKNVVIGSRNQKSLSFLGSLDLSYKNFLYFGLTGRNDYVSNLIVPSKEFNPGDIGFFYPSVNTSFVFSELTKLDFLDFGKIRVSYGIVGGGAPSPYQTSTVYTVPAPGDGWTDGITFPYNGIIGLSLDNTKGSVNLKPSKTSDFEVGLETKLFRNKVTLEASYYTRSSTDQILSVPISSASGFTGAVLNSGALSTKGFDIVLGLTPINMTNSLRWDVNFNFTTWRTKVESLADGVLTQYLGGFSPGSYNIVGEQYGQLYGGAFMKTNDASGTKFDPNLPYNPSGKLIINDDKNDPDYGRPLVHPGDVKVGNPNPDFLLGINNSFSFKGITVSALIDIRYGGEMWNGTRGALANFGMSKETEQRGAEFVFDGYTATDGKPNTIKTKLDQSWYQGLGSGFGAVGSQFVENSGFARLRQVNISYRLPAGILKTLKMTDLTLGFVGRNLWLKTDYTGVDPETSLTGSRNSQGSDYFNMPGMKNYAFTLGVKF